MVEPPKTHLNLPYTFASYWIKVVRGGSVWSKHPEHSLVGLLFQEAKWLEEVWCTPNSLQIALSACFPLHLSGSRRFGVVKPSNHPELTRNCLVGLLTHASQWFEEVRWGRTTAL